MQYRADAFVEFYAALEQAGIMRAPGMKYDGGIRVAWQNQLNLDTAPCRFGECRQQLRIGNKVGLGDLYLPLGIADRGIREGILRRLINGRML